MLIGDPTALQRDTADGEGPSLTVGVPCRTPKQNRDRKGVGNGSHSFSTRPAEMALIGDPIALQRDTGRRKRLLHCWRSAVEQAFGLQPTFA